MRLKETMRYKRDNIIAKIICPYEIAKRHQEYMWHLSHLITLSWTFLIVINHDKITAETYLKKFEFYNINRQIICRDVHWAISTESY